MPSDEMEPEKIRKKIEDDRSLANSKLDVLKKQTEKIETFVRTCHLVSKAKSDILDKDTLMVESKQEFDKEKTRMDYEQVDIKDLDR
mmetsp:Transcript_4924/g.7375  ORF Transcript_4924/g.7375 Transcript_4924/m.7375 type:complete len:87 (+) Transcript_4924:221-481(+)